jgi:hypothetical protein
VQAGDLDRLALPVGLAAAAVVGWRLGFCDTRAQRDGARGERATARMLRQRHRHGWAGLTPFHMAFLRAARAPAQREGGRHTYVAKRGGVTRRSSALLRTLAFNGRQQTGSNRRS